MKYYSDHAAYFNDKNEEVPSVTTILKILNKPSLCKWANYLGFKRENVDKVLELSAEKGTAVHELLNSILFYTETDIRFSGDFTKEYMYSMLDNFNNWKSNHKLEPIFGERQFSCDEFGGTVDLYCKLDDKYTILDFKTSKKFYSSMFIQLSAYYYMLNLHGYEVDQVCILLVNDKICMHKIMDVKDINDYIDTFLLLSKLFNKVYKLNEEWGDLLENKKKEKVITKLF